MKILKFQFNFNKKFSFTIIELLVVISIITLLASIIILNIQESREKAKIAKVMEFAQSLQSLLGIEAVGVWYFNEGTGPIVKDASGYENQGTINGASWVDSEISGTALKFEGDDYIEVPYSSSLNIIKEITISVWVKLAVDGPDQSEGAGIIGKTDFTASFGYSYGLLVNYDAGEFDLEIGAAPFTSYILQSNTIPVKDKWYHLVGVFKDKNAKIYINGTLDREDDTGPKEIYPSNFPLKIGSRFETIELYFQGVIDEPRIYRKALTSAQIQKLYVEGFKKKKLVIQ
jgi:type II secretory pathway pseudopilin PulG